MKQLHVVAAILRDADGRVLLAQRTDAEHAGLWEFPGGKVEPGKTARVYIDNLKDEAKGKPSDSNKPAATRPSASDKKADSKNDGKKQGLAKTGVDVRSWPVRWSPWPCWVPRASRWPSLL